MIQLMIIENKYFAHSISGDESRISYFHQPIHLPMLKENLPIQGDKDDEKELPEKSTKKETSNDTAKSSEI